MPNAADVKRKDAQKYLVPRAFFGSGRFAGGGRLSIYREAGKQAAPGKSPGRLVRQITRLPHSPNGKMICAGFVDVDQLQRDADLFGQIDVVAVQELIGDNDMLGEKMLIAYVRF